MKFCRKPIVVDAITFDGLVQYGRDIGAKIVNGMPWSFNYCGYPVTHENDECYLIGTFTKTLILTPGHILVIDIDHKICVYDEDDFYRTHDEII